MTSTSGVADPGAVTASYPGGLFRALADPYAPASVVYRWQAANGELPPDHVSINHLIRFDGTLRTELNPYNGYGHAIAKYTINGFSEMDYKVARPIEQGGGYRSQTAILLPGLSQTARRYFADPAKVSQIDASFDMGASVDARIGVYYDIGTDAFIGSASATSSRSARTEGFNVSQ